MIVDSASEQIGAFSAWQIDKLTCVLPFDFQIDFSISWLRKRMSGMLFDD